jgi:hypothetical protein
MKPYTDLITLIEDVVDDTVGKHDQHLYAIIKNDDRNISLVFAQWCPVVKDYVEVTDEDNQPITAVWSKKQRATEVMKEAHEVSSQAYKQHMDRMRKAEEKGLL